MSDNEDFSIEIEDRIRKLKKVEMDNTFTDRTKCHNCYPNKQDATYFDCNLKNAIPSAKNPNKESEVVMKNRRSKLTTEALTFPYSSIGLITCSIRDKNGHIGQKYGTGTLIADNVVLTCAHNVYDKAYSIDKITFSLGMQNNKCTHISEVNLDYIYVNQEYINDTQYSDEDYAIVILKDNPGKRYGYMGIAIDYQIEKNKNYFLYGFPLDKCKSDKDSDKTEFDIWGMKSDDSEDYIIKIENNMLLYTAFDTFKGNSGSSIYVQEENKSAFVYGIHIEGASLLSKYNKGVLITKSRFDIIVNWIKDSKVRTSFFKYETLLDLSCINFGTIGDEVLKISNLNFLTHLILSNCKLDDNEISFLESSDFNSLTTLDLSINKIESIKILSGNNFNNLKELNLFWNNVDGEGFKFLEKKCSFHKTLEVLKMRCNQLGDKGVKFIKKFENLNFIELSENEITIDGIKNLSECNFKRLITLDLTRNIIGPKGTEYLIKCQFKELQILLIGLCGIEDDGLITLSKGSNFPKLKELNLFDNMITDKSLKSLANSYLKNLTILDLTLNFIEDDGVEILCNSMINLTKLYLNENNINEEAIDILIKKGFKHSENFTFFK